jgi:predicted DNA-binding transcriptional regulator AlpA
MTIEVEGFLTIKEAAGLLGKSRWTLNLWRVKKIGPPWYKVGGSVYYKRADILTWIEEQRV